MKLTIQYEIKKEDKQLNCTDIINDLRQITQRLGKVVQDFFSNDVHGCKGESKNFMTKFKQDFSTAASDSNEIHKTEKLMDSHSLTR